MMNKSVLEQNCILPPLTMQEISCIKIMTMLCNNRKLKNLILECNFHNADTSSKLCTRSGKEWEAVEAMANEMLSQICESTLLKKGMMEYLWPVSYRMTLWRSTYAPTIRNSFLKHFHWTSRGRIDNTRTVRCIVRNRNISVRERFVLACSVCLRNEVIGIWREFSKEDEVYFHEEHSDRISPLTFFWVHALEEYYYTIEQLNRALTCALEIGLLEAVKYLFSMAPREEMIFMPSSCSELFITKLRSGELLEEDENDIEYFAFSQMTDEQQEGTIRYFPETVLSFLLHSSKYELCLNLLEERMESASVRDIARALKMIFYTYHLEVANDEDCRFLFMDFWLKLSSGMRREKLIKDLSSEFLFVLIRDNFPFLLEKEAYRKIDELASLDLKFNIFDKQVDFHQGKGYLLHFIIKEIVTIPLIKKGNTKFLFYSRESQSNVAALNNVLSFVQKVQSKNPI